MKAAYCEKRSCPSVWPGWWLSLSSEMLFNFCNATVEMCNISNQRNFTFSAGFWNYNSHLLSYSPKEIMKNVYPLSQELNTCQKLLDELFFFNDLQEAWFIVKAVHRCQDTEPSWQQSVMKYCHKMCKTHSHRNKTQSSWKGSFSFSVTCRYNYHHFLKSHLSFEGLIYRTPKSQVSICPHWINPTISGLSYHEVR